MIQKKFSPLRLFGGIGMILFTCALIAGCGYATGRIIYVFALALPGFGIGISMIAKPFTLACAQCQVPLKRRCSVPLSIGALHQATNAANTGNPALIEGLVRSAPIPDGVPYGFCAMVLHVCPQCGQSGALHVHTYTTAKGRPTVEKSHVEFGAGIGEPLLSLIEQEAPKRWAATQQYRGFGDPAAMPGAAPLPPRPVQAPVPQAPPQLAAPPPVPRLPPPGPQQVMVRGPDGREYAGEVISRAAGQVQVRFPNGSSTWLPEANVRAGGPAPQ